MKKLWVVIFCLFIAGCQATATSPVATTIPTSIVTETPARGASVTPLLIPWTATPPAATPTPFPTPAIATEWLVNAQTIANWPENASLASSSWMNDTTLQLSTGFMGEQWLSFSPNENRTASFLPTATPFYQADPNDVIWSPKHSYLILCSEKVEREIDDPYPPAYHQLALYRASDHRLISKVGNISTLCQFAIRWATDESILSFVSRSEQPGQELPPADIFSWRPDGSPPYKIGEGNYNDEPGTWSPDHKRLVLEFHNNQAMNPDDEGTFHLLYADGRKATTTKAQTYVRAMPGLTWLTNEIVYELSTCCGACVYYHYYVADSGQPLEDLSWGSCSPFTVDVQPPVLSPDQNWFVVDRSHQFDPGDPVNFEYILYHLPTQKPYLLSSSADLFLAFVGWDAHSSAFYLICRPVNDAAKEELGAPFGLLSLDPKTQKMRLIAPEIRYAWLSPDREYFYGLAKKGDQYTGAIYSLDGKPVTALTPLMMPPPRMKEDFYKPLDIWNVPSEIGPIRVVWNNHSQRVMVQDQHGDLWTAAVSGEVQKLASKLPFDITAKFSTRGNWSPDDALFILPGVSQAWAIDMKKVGTP
jgi:hypothetical protein